MNIQKLKSKQNINISGHFKIKKKVNDVHLYIRTYFETIEDMEIQA